MIVVPQSEEPPRNREGLRAFLEKVKALAVTKGHAHVASISLKVRHIAPLAVLQSIYEVSERHAYFEHPQEDIAVAAAEAIVTFTASGESRYAQVKESAEALLEHTVCIGDMDTAMAGPRFFCAFHFEESGADPTACAFLPRWQVARAEGGYVAVANVLLHKESPITLLLDKIWAAYQRFASFRYSEEEAASADETLSAFDPLPEQPYPQWVSEALKGIARGDYEKVVLARAYDCELAHSRQPFEYLNQLRQRYAGCCTFSWGDGAGGAFIGATPELLCRVTERDLFTEALAGSAPRGKSAAEDAAFASELLSSEKDQREHAFVRDYIAARLGELGLEPKIPSEPRLRVLANVQHLHTPLRVSLPERSHLLDIAARLQPTPAVAGYPLEAAREKIAALEVAPRGLYSGALGWFDARGQGELFVALRCAWLRGKYARLFAGAGIVAESDPEAEMCETELKLSALRETLEQA